MNNKEIANAFQDLAKIMELHDENPFKIRAYRNVAEIIRNFEGDIVALTKDNQLKGIKGIGDALQSKLHEMASTGEMTFYQNLKDEFPLPYSTCLNSKDWGQKRFEHCMKF